MTSEIILQAIVTGLMMGLIYALIAAGLSLIFGLMDIVNFAHGEHLMLSMFSSFWLWSLFGIDPIFSIPITVLLMAVCGILTHYFLIRYILKAKMFIDNDYDLIIGSRFVNKNPYLNDGMPLLRYLTNKTFSQVTSYLLKINLTEFHTGFKIFSKKFTQKNNRTF